MVIRVGDRRSRHRKQSADGCSRNRTDQARAIYKQTLIRPTLLRQFLAGTSGLIQLLRRRPTISASGRDSGRDGVVPFGMERIALDIEPGHLVVADLDPLGVYAAIEFAS